MRPSPKVAKTLLSRTTSLRWVKLILLTGCVWGASSPLHSENLIFNSGFEVGESGYVCVKYLRPDTNPELKYEAPALDASTFVTGKQSLHIPNRYAEQVRFVMREVELSPNTKYTVSVWMKSDVDGGEANLSVTSSAPIGWDTKSRDFLLTKEWKKYEFSFTTGENPGNRFYNVQVYSCKRPESPAGDIWLDNFQLNQGGPLPYQSGSDIEIAVKPEKKLYVKSDGQDSAKVKCSLQIANYSSVSFEGEIDLEISLDDSGNLPEENLRERETRSLGKVHLEAGEVKTVETEIPIKEFGLFRFSPRVQGSRAYRSWQDYTAVVGEYHWTPLDLKKSPCIAMNMGSLGFGYPPRFDFPKWSFYGAGGSQQDLMEMLAKMGCRLLRDYDTPNPSFAWRLVEPEDGKFDFRVADLTVSTASKFGIEIMPVVGQSDFIWENKKRDSVLNGLPDWLIKKSREAKDTPWRIPGFSIYHPPLEDWTEYVGAIARRYKGKIKYYEILNEPNLYMSPKTYLEYLKAAFKELKDVDDANQVVAMSSTGDINGRLKEFVLDSVKLGALSYADIVSFHPYDGPNLGSPTPADRQIKELQLLLGSAGGAPPPLWNTELYYLSGKGESDFEKNLIKPSDVVQRFLVDVGEGVIQSIPVRWPEFFKNKVARHFATSMGNLNDQTPNANFVAYNALARLLEGAKPIDKIKWGNDTICYVFERNGDCVAAFWNYGTSKEVALITDSASLSGRVERFDIYGNNVLIPNNSWEITEYPEYLRTDIKNRDLLIKTLKKSSTQTAKPVEIGATRLIPRGNEWFLAVGLRNCTNRELVGKAGFRGPGIVAKQMSEFKLPPLQDVSVEIALKDDIVLSNKDLPVEVKISLEGKIWNFPVSLNAPSKKIVAVKGKETSENLEIRSKGSSSQQAAFQTLVDEENFYLKLDVKDKTSSGPSNGREPYEQDCVELFFDAEPTRLSSQHSSSYHENIGRLFIVPHASRDDQLVIVSNALTGLNKEKLKLRVEPSAEGYTVNLTVPLSSLGISNPIDGKTIGFDIAIDDADGAQRASAILNWNSPGQAHKDRLTFGFITFSDKN